MNTGLIGYKFGMTRVFMDNGRAIPVTLIVVMENVITQIKTRRNNGYNAIQVSAIKKKNIKKSLLRHVSKFDIKYIYNSREIKIKGDINFYCLWYKLDVNIFTIGDYVDILSKSKGRGFSGVVKRYKFSCQKASHGNSLSHRAPGAIGQCQSPGKVFKGKKMAGHMGDSNVSKQSLRIIDINLKLNLLIIKGCVSGWSNTMALIKIAIKS